MDPLDILHAARHPDPYPWYRRLAAHADALVRDDRLDLWIAARPDVVRAALAEPALRVRPPDAPVPAPLAGSPAGDWFGRLVRMNDGAQTHAAGRAALVAGLHAVTPADAQAAVLAACALPFGGPGWTEDLPLRAVATLLGVPPPAHADVLAHVHTLAAAVGGRSDAAPASAAARALREVLGEVAAHAPPGSLVGTVARQPWPVCEALVDNLAGLLTQTCDATAGLLGNAVVAVARGARPDDAEALVDAVLRDDPPIHHTRRFAADAVSLAGTALPPGANVLVVLVGADLAFGGGRHACPGASLARWITVAGLREARARGWPWPEPAGYRPLPNARIPVFRP